MKKYVLLLIFTTFFSFSQEKEFNYHFDYFIKVSVKLYGNKIIHNGFLFKNSKDSTYSLEIKFTDKDTVAQIFDYKKIDITKFEVDFVFKDIDDLSKLKSPILYTKVYPDNKKKYKNFHEEMEYENDTINNQILVHITQFKNKKNKKIINEHYYYFTKKENIEPIEILNFKNKLINKYKLQILENYNLEKTLCIIDGKISSEYLTHKIEKINYDFKYSVIKSVN